MKILAVEFSSRARNVAVLQCGDGVSPALLGRAAERSVRRPLGLIADALQAARCEREEIEVIAIGLGPGSYTGIRGAIALAQGWQLGRGVHLLGVSTVECLAAQAAEQKIFGPVNIVIDAQRNEFYLARYEIAPAQWRPAEPLRLATVAEIQQLHRAGQRIVGPDAGQWFANAREIYPDAAILGRLACGRQDFVAGEKLEPIYLREVSFVKAPPVRAII
ncbi:MAG TPA: tRNA (adenosine(37)-N6)-threonylcarbamoyltransferase complex dimerization subunit type 1 TsaB [Candidatus Baltobacteraceae bacterium]|jgi:tRNA threonylcarbamoyladenosine biosynthesis protein TsaB|nr:tRNA (adenosine(37)-N6)-threonylcarbamoyltransferase complex dimerization subunit type 1 TsaB [Candidatus Baltobacteraceae bacterium]